jgi:hypothetical protein
MKRNFTLGPWHVGANMTHIFPDGHGLTISHVASTIGSDYPETMRKANAYLIAASPELLEWAELLDSLIEYQIRGDKLAGDQEGANLKQFTLMRLRDTIAKALGQGGDL